MPKIIPLRTRNAIIKLYGKRCSFREIADKFGYDPRTILRLVKDYEYDRYGIHPRAYRRIINLAKYVNTDIESVLIKIMQRHGCWGKDKHLSEKRIKYRRRLDDLDQTILLSFIEMAGSGDNINAFIMDEIKTIRKEINEISQNQKQQ